jgi:hypothetical protein
MQVVLAPSVIDYFNDLVTVLLDKDYFGTPEFAIEYVRDLAHSILHLLPNKYAKVAPPYYHRYAPQQLVLYTTFIHSRHTQWYVFFTKHKKGLEDIYYVVHISNNHVDSHRLFPSNR